MSCCQNVPQVACAIEEILNRIEPIQYVNDTLVINSPLSVETAVYINEEPLTIVDNVLDLPDTSTIDGNPLDGLPFTGDILELPPQTTIDGFSIFTTNYFYFFNTSGYTSSGNYIIGSNILAFGVIVPTTNLVFSFFAPEDCFLTSLVFSFAVQSSAPSTIINATAEIHVIDPSNPLVVINTGITATIPSCPRGTKYYADTTFQYSLPKGWSVGIYFTYAGSAGGTCQFATLGYKFVPPV